MHAQSLQSTLWTIASRAPLSMRFSRQEYWSGLPFPFPGHFPKQVILHCRWTLCHLGNQESFHSLAYEITHRLSYSLPVISDTPVPWRHSSLSEVVHTLTCGTCLSLDKSTSCLSLCLSLNSFCDETSRTWASWSPETKCVTSEDCSSPIWVIWFQPENLKGRKAIYTEWKIFFLIYF